MAPLAEPAGTSTPAWYRTVLRSWRSGSGIVPTSRAGAEIAVLITLVGWRIGTLAQIAPAIPDALTRSQRPWLNALLFGLVVVESIILLTWAIRRRGYQSLSWALAETVLGCTCLLLEPWYVPVDHRVGTWIGWAPGLAVNITANAALGCARRSQTFALASCLAASYFVVGYPEVGHGTVLATVVSNTLTYFVFAVLCRTMAGFVRRFGHDADAAREAAVVAGRSAEVERHRRLLHDPASLLRYLANPDLDPQVASAVRAQALAEANRIRAFLTDPRLSSGADDESSTALATTVRAAAIGFTDLPIQLLVDLAADVELTPAASAALRSAVATVLLNVRQHAGAGASVVVHADHNRHEGEWEVVVRDDGQGFDMPTTRRGFGLDSLAGDALSEHGIACHIISEVNVGTAVTIRGRVTT